MVRVNSAFFLNFKIKIFRPSQIFCSLLHWAGHHNQLTTLKSGDDAVQKFEKVLTVIYSEESLAARKERNKTTMGAIKQLENIYMLMPPAGIRVMKKARLLRCLIMNCYYEVMSCHANDYCCCSSSFDRLVNSGFTMMAATGVIPSMA